MSVYNTNTMLNWAGCVNWSGFDLILLRSVELKSFKRRNNPQAQGYEMEKGYVTKERKYDRDTAMVQRRA